VAHAKASDQTRATVGASRLVKCQYRIKAGASIVRVAARMLVGEAGRTCGLGSVCGTEIILEGLGRVARFCARGLNLSYL
jgi:hypothetical protein